MIVALKISAYLIARWLCDRYGTRFSCYAILSDILTCATVQPKLRFLGASAQPLGFQAAN